MKTLVLISSSINTSTTLTINNESGSIVADKLTPLINQKEAVIISSDKFNSNWWLATALAKKCLLEPRRVAPTWEKGNEARNLENLWSVAWDQKGKKVVVCVVELEFLDGFLNFLVDRIYYSSLSWYCREINHGDAIVVDLENQMCYRVSS